MSQRSDQIAEGNGGFNGPANHDFRSHYLSRSQIMMRSVSDPQSWISNPRNEPTTARALAAPRVSCVIVFVILEKLQPPRWPLDLCVGEKEMARLVEKEKKNSF